MKTEIKLLIILIAVLVFLLGMTAPPGKTCYGPYGGILAFTGAIGTLLSFGGGLIWLIFIRPEKPEIETIIGSADKTLAKVVYIGIGFLVITLIISQFNMAAC